MIGWAILDPSGRVPVSLGRSREVPTGAVALPKGLATEVAATLMLDAGAWVPRPALPEATEAAGPAGLVVSWTGVPAGTVARVFDGEVGTDLATASERAGAITLTLADPGPYVIDLRPPLPWVPVSLVVTA